MSVYTLNTGALNTRAGGVIKDYYTNIGNQSTTETDLYSLTTSPNILEHAGYKLEAQYGGSFVSSATATRRLRTYFAGALIFDSGALTLSSSSAWDVHALIIRTGTSTARSIVRMLTQGTSITAYTAINTLTGLDFSDNNIIKITGTAAGTGAASNDIVAKLGSVSYFPSAEGSNYPVNFLSFNGQPMLFNGQPIIYTGS